MAQTVPVKLSKFDNQPWGFRIQGGKDFSTPITVQKVNGGSLAERAGLNAGDTILSINGIDALKLRHKEAQDTLVKAGNNFEIVVVRGNVWKPAVTPLAEPKPQQNGETLLTKTSLAASQQAPPVNGAAGQQYNSPVGLYSEESIAETLTAQAEVLAQGVLGVNFKKNERQYNSAQSEVFKMLQEIDSSPKVPEAEPPVHAMSSRPAGIRPVEPPKPKPKSDEPSASAQELTKCGDCDRLIVGVFVKIKDRNLHVECFKCATCGTSLKNVGYYNISGKLYCDIHARQAARHNPPVENTEHITTESSSPVPPQLEKIRPRAQAAAQLQAAAAAAPVPAPAPAPAPEPIAPVFQPAPSPVPAAVPQIRAPAFNPVSAPKSGLQERPLSVSPSVSPPTRIETNSNIQAALSTKPVRNDVYSTTLSSNLNISIVPQVSSPPLERGTSAGLTINSGHVIPESQSSAGTAMKLKPIDVIAPPKSPTIGNMYSRPFYGAPKSPQPIGLNSKSVLDPSDVPSVGRKMSWTPANAVVSSSKIGVEINANSDQLPKVVSSSGIKTGDAALPPSTLSKLVSPSRIVEDRISSPSEKKEIASSISPPVSTSSHTDLDEKMEYEPWHDLLNLKIKGNGIGTGTGTGKRVECCSCKKMIERGPFVTALGRNWCPEHFVCANESCKRHLQDTGFVQEKNELYCESCFESYLAPVCDKCQKRVVGDCLKAIGKQFHPECFSCAYCGRLFGNSRFYLEDGLPYCEADWNELFTTKCFGCGFPIEAGDRWVEAMNNNYHSQCFNCSVCKKNLEGQSFLAKGGKPMCKSHAARI